MLPHDRRLECKEKVTARRGEDGKKRRFWAENGGAEVGSGRKRGSKVEFVWYYRGRGLA